MKKALVIIFIALPLILLYQSVEHNPASSDALDGFAIVNKSFNRDLKISLRLYKSFEKYIKPEGLPFYLVVPNDEMQLFKHAFSEARLTGGIKQSPIFITEEEVLKKCGPDVYEKAKNMPGWEVQQVIKLCFGKTGLAKNYLTIDSDTYFTKEFDSRNLFAGNTAKIFARKIHKNNGEKFKKDDESFYLQLKNIKAIMGDYSNDYSNYIFDVAMWSTDSLNAMSEYLEKNNQYDFADIIMVAPIEMQWYGSFIKTQRAEKFLPLEEMFTHIGESFYSDKCVATKGLPWHYGITQNKADEEYINSCSKLNTFKYAAMRRLNREKSKVTWFFRNIYYSLIGA